MRDVRIGDRWRLWPGFALRGPGFPARGVLSLAPEGLAQAADKLVHQAHQRVTDAVAGDPSGGTALSGPDWDSFAEQFAETTLDTAATLQGIAGLPSFKAAVAWQNRPVLDSGVAPFLSWTPEVARTSRHRDRETLIAHYWQRFCVKNDSIGFFGPVGWGAWDLDRDGIAVEPGEGLIDTTNLYFSSWAIDTLAKTLDADLGLRDWAAPRRVPFVRLADGAVAVPGRPPTEVPREWFVVLGHCDGVRTARELQVMLGAEVDVAAVLAELVARRWVVWRAEVPAGAWPERWLRTWLDRVDDPGVRRRGLDRLDVLDHARDRIRSAGTEVGRLTDAMAALERDFTALTDTAAVREKGKTTAPCRAVVYSDCVRSATATLGADVHTALAPLDLLLTAARWLTGNLADRVLAKARAVYDRLRVDGPVDLASFWFACMPVLHGDAAGVATDLQREFQRRWADILDLPVDAARVRRSTRDVRERVAAAFGDAPRGWTASRYVSPDILVVADDAAAVARGDFELVVGELHLASNTVSFSVFVNQHPAPAELLAETDRDHQGPRLLPMLAKEHKARLSARIRQSLVRDQDYYVGLVDHTVDPTRPRTVLSADVLVEERSGELVVVLPDGAVFPAVDVFAHVLTTLSMDLFRVLPEADHTPRVAVDRLVIARETWRPPAGELTFARAKTEAARYALARRWRATMDLPRFVFVVSPAEPRPFYVDFDSPVYVEILAKAARRLARQDPSERLTITEMLPTPEQTWLTDDTGETYTAELRFVAVEDAPVSPSP